MSSLPYFSAHRYFFARALAGLATVWMRCVVQAGAGLSFFHAGMNERRNLEPLVTSAVAEGFVRFGGDWPDEIRKLALSMNLDVVRVARLLLALPDTRS